MRYELSGSGLLMTYEGAVINGGRWVVSHQPSKLLGV